MRPKPPESPSHPLFSADNCSLAAIIVTYNPDIALLASQFRQLPKDAIKVFVDNASTMELLRGVQQLAAGRDDVQLIENQNNLGLASAINQGVRRVQDVSSSCHYLILLDQDTEPGAGGIEALLAEFQQLSKIHPRLGCVGPRLVDVKTGLDHGFHQMRGWRWIRRHVKTGEPLPVANINGSGALMPLSVFQTLGGLNEAFFIDHVDTDWSFRVLASGYELYGVPEVTFQHRMGATSLRFWLFGWRVWPYRSPSRHYYLFRNTVRLLRMPQVPGVWKIWAPIKLLVTFFSHLCFDPMRWKQVREMARGVRAGLSG
jgi:rhamnosyltransferase